jgi:hypothetical protein
MFRLIPALLAGLALAAPIADAQSTRASKKLQVRFLAERIPAEIGQVRLMSGEWKSDDFDLPGNHLSPPQTPPERVFEVWSAAKNVSLAKISLPEPATSFVVILVPASKGGYSPVILPANNPNFKAGDVYFYNHADKTVLGYVGTSKFTLAPAKGTMLRPAGPKGDGKYYDVGLGFRDSDGDRPLSLARWPVQEGIRMYVFFYINPTTQRIDFRAVDEFIEAEDDRS